jgi:formamidopyrimidine-DNA glycosylase
MAELPEIAHLAYQMDQALTGKKITAVETVQPKCLNLSLEAFSQALVGARILGSRYHGKWIQISTSLGWLLINLGMGGEVLLVDRQTLPEKWRVIFDFDDATCLALNFWWFGYVHYIPTGALETHTMTARLGPNALDLSPSDLGGLLKGQRGSIKALLLDQSKLAGIGNAYIHDILFLAKLHPLRKIDSLADAEIDGLSNAIQLGLHISLDKGGSFYEKDLFGQPGQYTMDHIHIGYKENQSCPVCATPIIKIKTGSNSTFICPVCQPEPSH